MNVKAIVAIAGVGAAIFAATGSGEKVKWFIWNRIRAEINCMTFRKRSVVAWRILRGKL